MEETAIPWDEVGDDPVSRTLTEVASSCALALLRFDMDMEVDDAPDELDRLKATSLYLRAVEACDALASDDALRPRMQRLLDPVEARGGG